MVDCKSCEYENVCEMPDFVRNNLKMCKTHTPKVKQTNADRIRSMTDEELARFFDCGLGDVSINFHCEECDNHLNCDVCYLEWLQSEVK